MDLKVQIDDAAEKFEEIMQNVMRGNSVLIMDKHKAIARVVPVEYNQESGDNDKWTSDDFDIQLSKDN